MDLTFKTIELGKTNIEYRNNFLLRKLDYNI